MPTYGRIQHQLWGDAKFRALTPMAASGQAAWLYVAFGPHNRGVPGLFSVSRVSLAESLGWGRKACDRAVGELVDAGMLRVDWEAPLLWIPSAPRHDPPGNPNVVVGWWRALSPLPECGLRDEALVALGEFCRAKGEGFAKAFVEGLAKAFGEGFRERFWEGFLARGSYSCPCPYPNASPRTATTTGASPEPDNPPAPAPAPGSGHDPNPDPGNPTPGQAPSDLGGGGGAAARSGTAVAAAARFGGGAAGLLVEWNRWRKALRCLPANERLSPKLVAEFDALLADCDGDAILAAKAIHVFFRLEDEFVRRMFWGLPAFPSRRQECVARATMELAAQTAQREQAAKEQGTAPASPEVVRATVGQVRTMLRRAP